MSDVASVAPSDDAPSIQTPTANHKKKRSLQRRIRYLKKKGLSDAAVPRSQSAPCSDASPRSSPPPPASTHGQPSLTVTVINSGGHDEPEVSAGSSPPPTATPPSPAGQALLPSKFLAIDCEMVGGGPNGRINQLARCSIVSYEGDVVYDKFINPIMLVTDYRTRWSGIREDDLRTATPYWKARKEILKLLKGKVVIGHAIHNDFKVLGYSHPPTLTRDTSRNPLLNLKAGFAENECASLKRLTKAIFDRDIQTGRWGHCSVEDARATMELYKAVEAQWEQQLAAE